MVTIEHNLYVVVQEFDGERAPQPRPLQSGFSEHRAYRVLGVDSASETSEAYFILVNDNAEIWFISNKHLRAYGLFPGNRQLSFALDHDNSKKKVRVVHSDEW